METAEHRNRDDFAGVVLVHRAIRGSLPDTLMRSGLVEIADVFPGHVLEVLVVEDEHVIEGLAPQATDKIFQLQDSCRGSHRRLNHPRTGSTDAGSLSGARICHGEERTAAK
jgi:hypothetical protein